MMYIRVSQHNKERCLVTEAVCAWLVPIILIGLCVMCIGVVKKGKFMAKEMKYLSMKEKREIAQKGGRVSLCSTGSKNRNFLIAKLRGTIFDGSLNKKAFKI